METWNLLFLILFWTAAVLLPLLYLKHAEEEAHIDVNDLASLIPVKKSPAI